jgi:hypothetical protein
VYLCALRTIACPPEEPTTHCGYPTASDLGTACGRLFAQTGGAMGTNRHVGMVRRLLKMSHAVSLSGASREGEKIEELRR